MLSHRRLRALNIFLIAFFGLGFVFYAAWNMGGAFLAMARYKLLLNSPFSPAELRVSDILKLSPQAAFATLGGQAQLVIPKISVRTPVVIPKNNSKEAILASLESGVGIYPNSVPPGERGRAVLLGHSSRATWYRGDYAHVFSLLSKIKAGDEFYVSTARHRLLYRVFETRILSPAETNTLTEGPAQGSELDLITCYPVGSASERTVVRAELVEKIEL